MANRYKKKGSATLITREMRFKTTVSYWVTTVTIVNIRKTKENNYWQECGEKGTLGYCWCACKLVQFCGKPGFPGSSAGKESACNVGNLGSVPGLGRSPGEGKGYQLQYSGLENSTDCLAYGVTKSWIQLSNLHFHCHSQQKSPKCSACVHAKSLQSWLTLGHHGL